MDPRAHACIACPDAAAGAIAAASRGELVFLPDGDAGALATVDVARLVARAGARDPLVCALAGAIADYRMGRDPAAAVADWIAGHTAYWPDPPGVEAVTVPGALMVQLLRDTRIRADCDDVAALAAALGLCLAVPARYVVAAFGDGEMAHIWTELYAPAAGWIPVDPTRPLALRPESITRVWAIPV